ncbi:flagella biosynthesis regulatory protein FliZ [Edwardsiella piscicida]|uniref:Flagellar biosynthesis protein FliZ n=3 Tax=Edwardsiella TaxID=635 RepID=A0A0H3DUC8_EDWTF|nr:flagella biosynthesis regulatory protein FliZ [Edwardsiella piscicida]ACY84960.1 flagellin protein FliZ [Edwardsiella tarda EIB202]ADM42028.1 Flagellar biosynthesis protein FliZ [Edwardsiella tarda FL6-60]ARD19592.1 flagellar regulatory protein FliZ [Edwardsiella piscicida]EKS7792410.1 flagella biosynthesis regulatory protein FliZ [Edwardsiella piscicida]EKS7813480.1 flagella biosynthesis regulatory protein FliZ [Edwardsiella piscicida]
MPLTSFPSSPAGRRPLSRYLKDFKHAQCYCSHCGRPLDRISLVLDGTLLNRARQAQMERLIDDAGWAALQQGLLALCRFCSDVYCHAQCSRFDIMGFKQYLCEQTDMRHSSIREYVVRLRRLDELLTHHVPPSTALSDLSDRWLAALPQCSQNNYRIALRKYQQYLQFAQAA